MTLSAFRQLVTRHSSQVTTCPVVLLEGRRAISEQDASLARGFANRLSREFVCLRFRSGNAEGSDEAFSAGVAEVDASRLQVIAPYASHRQKVRYADALYSSPESLSKVQEEAIMEAMKNGSFVYDLSGGAR